MVNIIRKIGAIAGDDVKAVEPRICWCVYGIGINIFLSGETDNLGTDT